MVADPEDCGGFIASDSPLVWGEIGGNGSLAQLDIEITFPLSKGLALVSYPGAARCTKEADAMVVAHINSRTHLNATEWLFHWDDDFMLERGGSIDLGSRYMEYL